MTWTQQSILNAVVAGSAKFRAMNRGQLLFYGRLNHQSISDFAVYKTALAVIGVDIDAAPGVAAAKKQRKPWKRTTPQPSRSKKAFKRPRDDLSVLTKELLVDHRMAGMSNLAIAKKYGFKSRQVKQRCNQVGVPRQVQLEQHPERPRARHWDTYKVFSASEDAISAAFAGRKFEDALRKLIFRKETLAQM